MNKDLKKAINIIKELIKDSPTIAGECGGDLSCFFCYEDHNQVEIHDKNCPYIKAREFIQKIDEDSIQKDCGSNGDSERII